MQEGEKIKESFVKKLKPPKQGQHIEWDNVIDGFGVRINSGGSIAFVLNYSLNKQRRRYKIGRYPELSATAARERALKLRAGLLDGIDPQEQKRQSDNAPTFKELTEHYLDHAETYKRESSLRSDRSNIGKLLIRWGLRQIKAITRADVEALHREYKPTPYQANRIVALLSCMFNLAIERKWRTDNPAKGIKKFQEDKRERWLTVEEITRLRNALDEYSDQNAADAIRLLILTGARENEVLKADWSQFDLKRKMWTKPSHHTKQKKIEHIPLNSEAINLLRNVGAKQAGPVFPGISGDHRTTLRRPWIQVLKAAGLAEAVEMKGKRRKVVRYKPTVRLHDLRHTFASHLVSKGKSLPIVGKLLGHTNPSTTNRYAHVADEAMREATESFDDIFTSGNAK